MKWDEFSIISAANTEGGSMPSPSQPAVELHPSEYSCLASPEIPNRMSYMQRSTANPWEIHSIYINPVNVCSLGVTY